MHPSPIPFGKSNCDTRRISRDGLGKREFCDKFKALPKHRTPQEASYQNTNKREKGWNSKQNDKRQPTRQSTFTLEIRSVVVVEVVVG